MTGPREYEQIVAAHFAALGYDVELTPYSGDYGVDVILTRRGERVAVQAKLFGHTSRRINRQMVMELYGAAAYRDCDRAVIATDGQLLPTALEVAEKLGVEIVHVGPDRRALPEDSSHDRAAEFNFDVIWRDYIEPLVGSTLTRANGDTNVVISVDATGVTRRTSNGRLNVIKIEAFEYAVGKLLRDGAVTRDEINQNNASRVSSGIILILGHVPQFEATTRPSGLRLRPGVEAALPSPPGLT